MKIIQLISGGALTALCDDGSVWQYTAVRLEDYSYKLDARGNVMCEWQRLPDIGVA